MAGFVTLNQLAKARAKGDDKAFHKLLIQYGEDFFKRSGEKKRKKERKWMQVIAWLAGDQLVTVDAATDMLSRIDTSSDPEHYVRAIVNRMKPIYRTMMAKMTQNCPVPEAIPNNPSETTDKSGARGGEKLISFLWQNYDYDDINKEVVAWKLTTGNAFLKMIWDPTIGEEKGGVPMGDPSVTVRSVFNFFPEPGKRSLLKMNMFGDMDMMDIDEAELVYELDDLKPDGDSEFSSYSGVVSSALDGVVQSNEDSGRVVRVKEMYILPNRFFPEGLTWRWINDKIAGDVEDYPELTYVHLGLIDLAGQFWKEGILEDILPIQARWNELISMIEMHNNLYTDPPMIIDPDSIDVNEWTSEPGLKISKKFPGAPDPFPVPVPPLDPSVQYELTVLDEQFEIIPILSKVSYGKDTPYASSGLAINYLQEKDNDVVKPLTDNLEAGWRRAFKIILSLAKDNIEEYRGFAIMGPNKKMEWVDFKKADLSEGTDIQVAKGSAMPTSLVAKQGMVLQMLDKGFFTDPASGMPNYTLAVKMMEFGTVEEIFEDLTMDLAQAERENGYLLEGRPVMPENWHNHQVHVTEHNKFRKTLEYENLPPEIKEIFNAHCVMHMEFLMPPATEMDENAENASGDAGALPSINQAPLDQISGTPDDVKAMLQKIEQVQPGVLAGLQNMGDKQRSQAVAVLSGMAGQGVTVPGQSGPIDNSLPNRVIQSSGGVPVAS